MAVIAADTFPIAAAARDERWLVPRVVLVSMLTMGAIGYGFGMVGSRQVVISMLFLFIWTIAIVLIIDIDRPRSGAIKVGTTPLVWTLQGFGPDAPAR